MKTVEVSFYCSRRAVVSFRNNIGLPELVIAKMGSDFVLSFTMCQFKSSSVICADILTSNDSEIAITDKLSLCNSSESFGNVNLRLGHFLLHPE